MVLLWNLTFGQCILDSESCFGYGIVCFKWNGKSFSLGLGDVQWRIFIPTIWLFVSYSQFILTKIKIFVTFYSFFWGSLIVFESSRQQKRGGGVRQQKSSRNDKWNNILIIGVHIRFGPTSGWRSISGWSIGD